MRTNIAIKKQAGYTIAEILIGVVVAAILAATAAAGYRMFKTSHDATTLANAITQAMNNISQSYSNSSSGFVGFFESDKSFITSSVFAPPFKVVDNASVSFNGSDLAFGAANIASDKTDNLAYYMGITMTPATCMAVLKTTGPGSFLAVSNASSTTVPSYATGVSWRAGHAWFSGSEINTLCTGANNVVTIYFYGQ